VFRARNNKRISHALTGEYKMTTSTPSTTFAVIATTIVGIATIAALIAASKTTVAARTGYVASVLPRHAAECASVNTKRIGGSERIAQFELCYYAARNR